MGDVTQEPGALDLTLRVGDDLSFDADFGIDLNNYDYSGIIVSMEDNGVVEIPITITATDLNTGKLHFFISSDSIKNVKISTNLNKWYFKWNTPKQQIPPISVFTRTILAGNFNVFGN